MQIIYYFTSVTDFADSEYAQFKVASPQGALRDIQVYYNLRSVDTSQLLIMATNIAWMIGTQSLPSAGIFAGLSGFCSKKKQTNFMKDFNQKTSHHKIIVQ